MKCCAALLLIFGPTAGFVRAADIGVVEEIVCKVNGDIITRSELEKDRRDAEAELRRQGLVGPRLQEAAERQARDALRGRIDQLLLVQKGKELNINVDTDVAKQLADIQRKANVADPEKFQQFVHDQLGEPYEDYKNEIKNGLLTQRVVRQEVSSKIQFKREELQKYYDEHKDEFQRKEQVFLREILVSTEGKDAAGVAAAEKKAKDLAARARKGEKFPDMAQLNSDNPANAQQGGAMGGFEKGQLRKEIEDAIWSQPRGYVAEPIKTAQGFEIYKVDEHQKAGLAAFEEVENEVTDKVFAPRMDPALREYLTKLRAESFLEIKPGYEDSGAAPGKNTAWSDPVQLKPQTVTKEEVAARPHRKRLLGAIPVPGTHSSTTGTSSSR